MTPDPRSNNVSDPGGIDLSKSYIAGMGTLRFADEEDCGLFQYAN